MGLSGTRPRIPNLPAEAATMRPRARPARMSAAGERLAVAYVDDCANGWGTVRVEDAATRNRLQQ